MQIHPHNVWKLNKKFIYLLIATAQNPAASWARKYSERLSRNQNVHTHTRGGGA